MKKKKYVFNNGAEKFTDEVERLISVTPSPQQLKFHEMGYYSFIHYGMNTFTGKEWGSGKETPSMFSPKKVDTDQWVRVLKESGSKMIIFTAKHHDGFCLFQTQHTEHSIKNSPYLDGKGDIVRQLADSCRKYDMKFGIYLSPWDRHDERYGTDAYNDYFAAQLNELCTNYGEIACFWFDGAKGKEAPDFAYDFDRYYTIIRNLQPDALISNCGPDVRWIGNEAGKCRESEWNTVPEELFNISAIEVKSQKTKKKSGIPQTIAKTDRDLGSREVLKGHDLIWYPAEADVSIHKGWFYSKRPKRKSAKELAEIYFNTVGANASLLMNVPPSKNGVIEKADVETLREFKKIIDKSFKKAVGYTVEKGGFAFEKDKDELILDLHETVYLKTIVISEELSKGQRVELFEVYSGRKGKFRKVAESTVIGSKRILRFDLLSKTDKIKLVIKQSRGCPIIKDIEVYK